MTAIVDPDVPHYVKRGGKVAERSGEMPDTEYVFSQHSHHNETMFLTSIEAPSSRIEGNCQL